MKIRFIILLSALFFLSCNNKNYYGYVYDADNNSAIVNVEVYDALNNVKVFTDKSGCFSLKKNNNISSELIFFKHGYRKRKIKSISIQNGEMQKENFTGEKIYLFKN